MLWRVPAAVVTAHQRVDGARRPARVAMTVVATPKAASFSGMVRLSPRHVSSRPATNPASSASSSSCAAYAQPVSPDAR